MKYCFLFPGQGSQYPGMAKDLWEKLPAVRDLFAKAADASGTDAQKLLFDSTAEELKATDKTQIAITIANLAASAALKAAGIAPRGCAGFSLGEYAALCEAGVVSLHDVFPIVKLRGMLMEKAARSLDADSGAPGMAAVLGLPTDKVASAMESLAGAGVFLANQNSPTQVVVSGTATGLAKAEKVFKETGAKRFVRLSVSGPFHSPLLSDARRAFDEALAGYTFADPKVPVYSNVTGAAIRSGEEARRLCGEQVMSPVRWVSVEQSLFADGFDRFFETGPGTVLTGLMKALSPQAVCLPAGTADAIEKAARAG
ncbi:MAG TPA: ACP S-malonyltransferase [Spirochaetia bacterium]|nr:ACP S-malonyltransferase [Spirochaetia bacterium]